jgi:hypothetical protein
MLVYNPTAMSELPQSAATPKIYEVEGDRRFRFGQPGHVRRSQSHELSAISPARALIQMNIDATIDASYDSEYDLTLNELRVVEVHGTAPQ